MDKCGVLVLQGRDHRRQFATALELLYTPPPSMDKEFCQANIEMVWVRKFGPLGVVQLRFQTNEATLAYLRSRSAQTRVDLALREANPDRYAKRDFDPALLVVNDAPDPTHHDPTIEHQIWEGPCADLLSGSDNRLQQFAAILAAHRGIELAQYESTRLAPPGVQSSLFQVFRFFDHQRRGPLWLERQVNDARQLIHSNPDYHFKIEMKNPEKPGVASYLNKMLRVHTDYGKKRGPSYIYLSVHCTDHQGLFAELAAFFQSGFGTGRRKIVSGACRGMGDQGIVLLAALGNDTEAASLNRRLQDVMRSRKRLGGTYSRRLADGRQTVYDARVIDSKESPGLESAGTGKDGFVTMEGTHPRDTPGLLRKLCSRVLRQAGDDANFYLVDGRLHRQAHETTGSFDCALGLIVKCVYVEPLKRHLKEVLPLDGWEDLRIEGECF